MYDLKTWFLLFITYSFIGWVIEVIDILITKRKLVNRGFLIGPYCPIYGYGSIFILYFLSPYKNNPFLLFIMAVIICSVLEYVTSYVMEKIFKARWWDYSHKKFNLNGRICLATMIPFGLGGCLIIYFINPFLVHCLSLIPNLWQNILAIILLIIYGLDNLISFKVILNFKKVTNTIRKDSTEEISKRVRSVLTSKSYFGKRLMKAFPNVQAILKKHKKK